MRKIWIWKACFVLVTFFSKNNATAFRSNNDNAYTVLVIDMTFYNVDILIDQLSYDIYITTLNKYTKTNANLESTDICINPSISAYLITTNLCSFLQDRLDYKGHSITR